MVFIQLETIEYVDDDDDDDDDKHPARRLKFKLSSNLKHILGPE